MPSIGGDPNDVQAVLAAVIKRTSLPDLLEPLVIADDSIDTLMQTGLDEKA